MQHNQQQASYYGIDVAKSLTLCTDLAYEAGKKALEFTIAMNEGKLAIEIKQDESPVTVADKMLNEFIVGRLQAEFPTARVIGEESIKNVTKDLGEGPVFFVDPIDGTKEFIKNNGEWAVMIGLVVDAKPVMGVVYRPSTDDLYYASTGNGAFRISGGKQQQPVRIHANKHTLLSQCTFMVSRSHNHESVTTMIANNNGKSLVQGSFGIKCGYIASGLGDIYINPSRASHYWDACMNDIILSESGAVLLTSDGIPVSYTGKDTRVKDIMIAFPLTLDKNTVLKELNAALTSKQ